MSHLPSLLGPALAKEAAKGAAKRAVATLFLIILPAGSFATPEGWRPLFEPKELAALLEEYGDSIRVVHVTGDPAQGVIPGAGFAPYQAWRGPAENPGALRPLSDYERLVRELGINRDTPVVVVHAGTNATDFGAAARVYWTLKSLGIEDLALLNGGFAAWRAEGLPVAERPESFLPSDYVASWNDTWTIHTDEVAARAQSSSARLIDARPRAFFEGEQWTIAAPGTIHGAENLAYDTFFNGTRLLGAEQIRAIVARAGLAEQNQRQSTPAQPEVVSFCNTGHWAAINWFALSEIAGIEGVRLYPESMAEYSAKGLPLDNAPNRVEYFWRATKRWLSELFG